jgi:prolipoprotein diacylglyceryltransferase
MIPYFPEPVLRLGNLSIYAFGLFYAGGLILGSFVFLGRAEKYGLSQITGAYLLSFVVDRGGHRLSSFGAILAVLMLFAVSVYNGCIERHTFRQWLDTIAYASVFGWLVGRIGCALAHDHMGVKTGCFLGVQFPGGSRFDLGLLEVLFLLVLAVALCLSDSYHIVLSEGITFGIVCSLYSVFRFSIEFLRADGPKWHGLTPEQYLAVPLLLISICVLMGHPWLLKAEG